MKNQPFETLHSVILVVVVVCSMVALFDSQISQFNENTSSNETTKTYTPKPGCEHLNYKN